MSLITPSPTARSRLAVMHRGVPPVAGTTHIRSSRPASSPLSALYAMTSPRGDQIGDTMSKPVAILVGVSGDHQSRAVRRPVEAADIPRAVGQLRRLPAVGGHDEDVLVPAVAVADSVVLVIERAGDACHRRAPHLVAALGGTRVVDHTIRF